MPALRVRLHRDWGSIDPLVAEWDALAIESGADIYTSASHAQVWWKHYGRGEPLIAEVRCGSRSGEVGRLAGVVPLAIDRIFTPAGSARVCRPMGGHSTIAVLSPSIAPDIAEEVWKALLQAVLPLCDAVWLSPLSGYSEVSRAIDNARKRIACSARRRAIGVHATFVLPETFDAYVASLDKRQRGNLRREWNQLTKVRNVTVELLKSPADVARDFPQFVRMHTEQWNALSKGGHFADWPGAEAFSTELNAALASAGRVLLLRISQDGCPIAYEWCFVLGRQGFWRLPARLVNDDMERIGLGRMGMVRMLEAMIECGIRTVEAGPGHYEYKIKHGAVEAPLCSFWIARGRWLSSLRMNWVWLLTRAVDLLYYRMWFLKVRPRLVLEPRPLSTWWTRWRL